MKKRNVNMNVSKRKCLDELLDFQHIQNVHDEIITEMSTIIKDVHSRTDINIEKDLENTSLKCYHQILTKKHDNRRIEGIKCEIPIKEGASPMYSNPNHTSPPEQKVIDDASATLWKHGIITPYNGLWGAPVIVVRNNDGSLRLCVDYSQRNEITLDNSCPCPNVDDQLPECIQ